MALVILFVGCSTTTKVHKVIVPTVEYRAKIIVIAPKVSMNELSRIEVQLRDVLEKIYRTKRGIKYNIKIEIIK